MPTNKEWLFSLSLDELYAWFDAEHVDAQRDNNGTCPDAMGQSSNGDSREKLEADVRKLYTHSTSTSMYPPSANKTTDYIGCVSVDTVLGWLDRAADIREREFVQQYCAECETAENAALKSDIAVLRDRLDNLAAERDEKAGLLETAFRRCKELEAENDALLAAHADDVERLDAMGEGELQAQADEKWNMYVAEHERAEKLQAELDKWNEITKNIKLPEYPPFTQFVPRDDSREEIEREIDEWLGSWVAFSVPISVVKDAVIGWLDRQAAITTRKCSETYELGCEACRSAQKRKTDELEEERDYFRNQMLRCVACACRPGGFAAGVMQYPRPDGYTEPSLLVTDEIENLRTFYVESKEDSERWREGYGSILDEVHKIEGIISELGEK